MGVITSSVSSTNSPRTLQSYARLALAGLLALLTWSAFHSEYGNVPLVSDVSTAIHEFGHMLFMPFGIPILGTTMVILAGSLTEVAFPLLFVGYFLRKREDGRRRRCVRGYGLPLVVRDWPTRHRDLLRRLTRRQTHAPRRTDWPG